MKKLLLAVALIAITTATLFAQESLEDIFSSSNKFEEIVEQAETHFRKKHPNTSFKNLTQGEHRDGKFVKFMRWKNFWKNSLNPDGTLGDLSAHWRAERKTGKGLEKNSNPYASVAWTNLSYENYIVSQIGLGRTTSMAFHPTNPNIFYVGAAIGGIWKTTDGGQSYTPLGDELPFLAVSSIVVDQNNPNTIYIAVSDHVWYGPQGIGVYKSTDGGATWNPTALSFDFTDNIRIFRMIAVPGNPNKMFVATADGLYRTDNGFATVVKVNNISSFDVRINPGNTNIVYQGGNNGEFYRSTNGGTSFSLIQDFGSGNVYLAVTPLDVTKVYARNRTTMYKSFNNGASFTSTSTFSENNEVFTFAPNNDNIIVSGNFEVSRSTNDGASFSAITHWLGFFDLHQIHVDQRSVYTNPLENNYIYFCNDGGLYRYVVSTNVFENLCDGLKITQFYDIAVSQTDPNVISGGSQDNGNVFRSSTGVWDDHFATGDGMNQEIDPTNSNIRYWSVQNGSLKRWQSGSNIGISPPGENGNGAWETPYRLDPSNPSRIICGYEKVYESLDKGNTWTAISAALNGTNNLNEIAISASNGNRIYATRGSNLYVKNTANNTWTTKSMPATISDIEVSPTDMNTIYISVPGFSAGSKVFKSRDAGTTWINISGSLPNVSTGAIETYTDEAGGLFVGTDAGVYYLDDSLADWYEYGELPHTRVEDIEIQYSAQLIRVGTHGRGVLEAPININKCPAADPDTDNDGICDSVDECPNLDDSLIGAACDDGDPFSSGETYGTNCICDGGQANITYCGAAGSAGTGSDWINQVKLNTLDNTSGKTNYSDFRNQSTTLEVGGSYTLTISLNYVFPPDVAFAWIDFNKNGTFENSERITMSTFDGDKDSQGVVTVPAGAALGATTLRVRAIYNNNPPNDPCNNYFGEVEDYTVFIRDYCTGLGHVGTGSDWINQVKLNTINNISGKTRYSDFRSQAAMLDIGDSYNLTISLNYAFPADVAFAWIDFDRSGTFEDSERITMSTFNGAHDSQGTITVPLDTELGSTRLRVRAIYGSSAPADPCGNYAGEVEDYTIFITKPLYVNTKVFLGGAHSSGANMNTTLRTNGLIPLSQPYSSVYTGAESVSSIPADVVDWVLVELRNPSTTIVTQRAAFLKKDGTVVEMDGVSPVVFKTTVAGKYYIAIRHRNHLGVMTEMPILVD